MRHAKIPAYCRHGSGQAYVRLKQPDGSRRTVYLGLYGSPESRLAYARLIASLADGPEPGLTVRGLYEAFMRHAAVYYRVNGRETEEPANCALSFRAVLALHGDMDANRFGLPELKAARETMIGQGLSRKLINQRVGRVKRAFGWAAQEGLVDPAVALALRVLKGLAKGRSAAAELPDVRPAPLEGVLRAAAAAGKVVGGMILLQLHTGMRPGEVVGLSPREIDRSALPWRADLSHRFKMAYKGLRRVVWLGPKAREILEGLARWDEPDEAVFRPAENAPVHLKLRAGRCYGRWSYRQAVERACEKAGVPRFSPNQIRHTHATLVRRVHGLEGAQVALGHEKADITQVYAERDMELARRIAEEMG